jgi:uncharacterized protein YqgC (DUF456 family)
MSMLPIGLWLLAVALVVVGLVGTVLPALPGAALVFGGLVAAAWADGFVRVGWPSLTLIGILAALSYALDFIAGALGTRKLGGSAWGVTGSVIGAFVGMFFGIAGLILGPFIGAVLGEYLNRRHLGQAGKAGAGAWIGLVVGTAAKIALVVSMIGVFALAYAF